MLKFLICLLLLLNVVYASNNNHNVRNAVNKVLQSNSVKKHVNQNLKKNNNMKINTDNILCPVLAVMVGNQMLKPNKNGQVTRGELYKALHEYLGLGKVASKVLAGNAKYKPEDTTNANPVPKCGITTKCWWNKLFKRKENVKRIPDDNLVITITKLQNSRHEHVFSTGIRDPDGCALPLTNEKKTPCVERYRKLIKPQADKNGKYYKENINKIVCAAKKYGDRTKNPEHQPPVAVKLALHAAFQAICRKTKEDQRCHLTETDMFNFYINAQLPKGWKKRSNSNVFDLAKFATSKIPDQCPIKK